MRIKKILGKVAREHINHSVAKLENDRYAVGPLVIGQTVAIDAQFETLDAAFDHWLATLPLHGKSPQHEFGGEPMLQAQKEGDTYRA